MTDVDDVTEQSATEQRRMLSARMISARELLDAHLDRIERWNPVVNAVIALDPEVGRRRAAAVDQSVARGDELGPLAGLVTAHKDLTETADFPTTYGTLLRKGFRPPADSLLVERMRLAGAVAVGKTNTPELGAGSHTFNAVHGTTTNPFDPTRSAGGSSGGAGVALATGMVAIADGSDMGGSLRNPAAWNNVVGLRPTPRVVPTTRAANLWSPLATQGPMGRTVDDVRLLLSVIAQPDARDPLSAPLEVPPSLEPLPRPLRVAWSPDLGGLPIEQSQRSVLAHLPAVVEGLGWSVDEAEPDLAGADDAFLTLRAWEIASSVISQYGADAPLKAALLGEVRRGDALTVHDLARAYGRLGELRQRALSFFERYDVLLAPVTQCAPFPAAWEHPAEIEGVAMPTYTSWMASCYRITALGVPALSLPAGFDEAGLPVGVQIIGAPGADVAVLRAAAMLESATGHGRRRPVPPDGRAA